MLSVTVCKLNYICHDGIDKLKNMILKFIIAAVNLFCKL